MRFTRWVSILLTTLVLNASAADIAGTWKTVCAGPKGTGPKTIGSIILILNTDGHQVTGTARIGVWPGDAPIADGKVDGDQITFNATGHLTSTTGIPTCGVVATIHGDEMVLTLSFIADNGVPVPPENRHEFEYEGKRISD